MRGGSQSVRWRRKRSGGARDAAGLDISLHTLTDTHKSSLLSVTGEHNCFFRAQTTRSQGHGLTMQLPIDIECMCTRWLWAAHPPSSCELGERGHCRESSPHHITHHRWARQRKAVSCASKPLASRFKPAARASRALAVSPQTRLQRSRLKSARSSRAGAGPRAASGHAGPEGHHWRWRRGPPLPRSCLAADGAAAAAAAVAGRQRRQPHCGGRSPVAARRRRLRLLSLETLEGAAGAGAGTGRPLERAAWGLRRQAPAGASLLWPAPRTTHVRHNAHARRKERADCSFIFLQLHRSAPQRNLCALLE